MGKNLNFLVAILRGGGAVSDARLASDCVASGCLMFLNQVATISQE